MAKQPILNELEYFVNGAITATSNNPSGLSHLVRCGLNLLHNLPASKDAVFEYFTIFFDASVAGYVKLIEQKDPNLVASYDSTVGEVQDVLETLINQGQHVWIPYISTWSIKTLGVLSKKYKRSDNRDIASTCNLWLGSSGMRCLLAVTVSCFEKVNASEEESFIEYLLNAYMQNPSSFDWVIARLGSCFPQKIIKRVLNCGLKLQTDGFGLDTEIGILSYLAFVQDVQLRSVLNEMVKNTLYENPKNTPLMYTIPYFFTLAGKSDVILQQMVSVFLDIYDDRFLQALSDQIKLWPSLNFNIKEMPPLTAVLLRIRKGATKVMLTIAEIADQNTWCHNLLESVLQEIFTLVNDNRVCPILSDVLEQNSQDLLISTSVSKSLIERQTAIRLILLASGQSSHIYHHSVSELLSYANHTENSNPVEALIRLMSGANFANEHVGLKPGVKIALERLLIDEFKMEDDSIDRNLNVLQNLLFVVSLEKQVGLARSKESQQTKALPHLKESLLTKTLTHCDITLMEIAKRYLTKAVEYVSFINASQDLAFEANDEPVSKKIKMVESRLNRKERCYKYTITYKRHIHAVMSLLDILEIGNKDEQLAMDKCIKWAELIVKYFFWSLTETDVSHRQIAIERVYLLLARQCSGRKYSRITALRELLDGALYSYGNLFGVHLDINIDKSVQSKKRDDRSLLKMNQMQNNTPNNIRSFLHAGIIGQGLKLPTKEASSPDVDIRNALLRAMIACCRQEDLPKTIDAFTSISLLLVEMISPDVMYNGLPWPDEEFSKITMERDLHIRRTFKNAPVLWSILALIANNRPSLCYTSVLLRAISATLLHQWRAKSVLHNQTVENNYEMFKITKNLLGIMAMGQLLCGPLAYLHVVIEHFEPFEIVVVLKECVWNYMKENIPAPLPFRISPNGLHWKDPSTTKINPQFVDPLRNIMQRKLPKLGMLYYYMFVASELD